MICCVAYGSYKVLWACVLPQATIVQNVDTLTQDDLLRSLDFYNTDQMEVECFMCEDPHVEEEEVIELSSSSDIE